MKTRSRTSPPTPHFHSLILPSYIDININKFQDAAEWTVSKALQKTLVGVGWSVGWLAGWLVGWLLGWLDGWLDVGWSEMSMTIHEKSIPNMVMIKSVHADSNIFLRIRDETFRTTFLSFACTQHDPSKSVDLNSVVCSRIRLSIAKDSLTTLFTIST